MEVREPRLLKNQRELDFGKGFYMAIRLLRFKEVMYYETGMHTESPKKSTLRILLTPAYNEYAESREAQE